MSKALFIFTTCNGYEKADGSKAQTGFYLPEAAHPYDVLTKAGWSVDFATVSGEASPVDQGSVDAFKEDASSVEWLGKFVKDGVVACKKLSDLKQSDYAAVVYPGGHGPMFDLASDSAVASWTATFYESVDNGIVGAVCHGPAALLPITLSNGDALIKGHRVTGFSNAEEDAVGLTSSMPFALETSLKEKGAEYSSADNWQANVVTSGRIVTGQNPASASAFGAAIIAARSC